MSQVKNNPEQEQSIEKTITRRTFLSFATLGVGAVGSYLGWRWLHGQSEVDGALAPLRTMLETNSSVNQSVVFSETHTAPEYPRSSAATEPRTNGDVGLDSEIDIAEWKLNVKHPSAMTPLSVTLDDIKALPKTDIVFEFKCVEGWSEIQYWSGVRLIDFFQHYNLQQNYHYVGMTTPDEEYYIGLDMASALHPQTILAYESNGTTISSEQGYPLRLVIPVKYGIKNLKRIGTIAISNERPPDYWAEQGYDYYAGL